MRPLHDQLVELKKLEVGQIDMVYGSRAAIYKVAKKLGMEVSVYADSPGYWEVHLRKK